MDILDDIGVSKLSAKNFLKVNYSFKHTIFVATPVRVLFMHNETLSCFLLV